MRFRPVMMTALAFVFGVMPMLFATGAGAVVFGMAVNALVGTLFVPSLWEILQRFQEKYLSKLFSGSTTSAALSSNGNQGTSDPPKSPSSQLVDKQ